MKRNYSITLILFILLVLNFSFVSFDKTAPRITLATSYHNVISDTKAYLATFASDALLNDLNNQINSPLSMFLVLSMMCETVDQPYQEIMLNYLGLDSLNELRLINRQIVSTYQSNSLAKEFNLKNFSYRNLSLVNDGYHYNQTVIDNLKTDYQATDRLVDFSNAAEEIATNIEKATNKFLKVSPNSLKLFLNPLITELLINVIYFKDNWLDKFTSNQIIDEKFTNQLNSQIVKMLSGVKNGLFFENDLVRIGTLLFEQGCKMYFILPTEDQSITSALTNQVINKIVSSEYAFESYEIDYKIPKFDLTYFLDFTDFLKNQGLSAIFDSTNSIGKDYLPGVDWSYQNVIQSSRIQLDEEGVKAATATFGCGGMKAAPPQFASLHLTRPFIYLITTPDNFILFSGIINSL